MSKLLTLLGLCLIAGLIFFTQTGGARRGSTRDHDAAQQALQGHGATPISQAAQRDSRSPEGGPAALEPESLALEPGTREELSGKQLNAKSKVSSPKQRLFKGTLVANGAPLRGGVLRLYSGSEVLANSESDAKGDFELKFPVPAEQLVLRIDTRGYALMERDFGDQYVPGQQLLGNIFLETGSLLSGSVVDEAGTAIAGAEVIMSLIPGRASNQSIGERVLTDKAGRFQFNSAPPGRVNLSASSKGYGLESLSHFHNPGQEAKLTLHPGGSLRVKVIEIGGEPVAGVRLSLRSDTGDIPARQAESNAEGIALFDNLVQTNWSLHSIARGYRPGILRPLSLESTEVLLTLVPWPRARGLLRAPDGAPVPEGTEMHAILDSQRGDLTGRLPRGAPVAEDGSYELIDLRQGSYRARASAPGYASSFSPVFHVAESGDSQVAAFELQRGGQVILKLQSGGKPVIGVRGEVLRQPPREAQLWSEPMLPPDQLPTSDAEGLLRLEGQSPGDVWILLRGTDLVPLQVGPVRVQDEVEKQLSETFNMALAGKLSGQLRADTGAVVGLGRVRLNGGNIRVPAQLTDQNGRFNFTNLPPGNYSLLTSGSTAGRLLEGAPMDVNVTSGKTTEVNITLEGE